MINGGSIAMLGIMPDETGIAWTDVVFKGLNIKGIYGREMYETWYKMVMMVQSGLPIERIITHRFTTPNFRKDSTLCARGSRAK
jgi:threonine 3-dehydrogenase